MAPDLAPGRLCCWRVVRCAELLRLRRLASADVHRGRERADRVDGAAGPDVHSREITHGRDGSSDRQARRTDWHRGAGGGASAGIVRLDTGGGCRWADCGLDLAREGFHESGFTITLLRFDQGLVTLALHAGGSQPGGQGWRYGDAIGRRERRIVVAAFNSAFQESYGAGGFEEGGRVGWPLLRGAASVVIYRDGTADVGR